MAMEFKTTEEAWLAGYHVGLKNIHGIDCRGCIYRKHYEEKNGNR